MTSRMTTEDLREKAPLWAWLASSLVVVSVVSALGGAVTATSIEEWYPTLLKPDATPADAVFPAVWSILFAMMGIAAFLVLRASGGFEAGRTALVAYGAQLALNILWSAIFFGLRMPLVAAFEIIVLLAAICMTIALFWRWSRTGALLLVPYALWVAFATWLTWSIALLNL
jgi:tryptophan-rich sensory protein